LAAEERRKAEKTEEEVGPELQGIVIAGVYGWKSWPLTPGPSPRVRGEGSKR